MKESAYRDVFLMERLKEENRNIAVLSDGRATG
jgi:hypothetical protein